MNQMTNLIEKYNQFILNLTPSVSWKLTRFILHWVTIPVKLSLIGGLGIFQILSKLFFKSRIINVSAKFKIRQTFFRHVFNNLPVCITYTENLYVNRVPLSVLPNGSNHNTDHQASRQGTYAFILTKLGLRDERVDYSLGLHIKDGKLARGYKDHFLDGDKIYNFENVSGDMLCGLSLGMLGTENEHLKNKYKELVENIIKNDYALLDSSETEKSDRGMWQPGLETVGAQALTLLAALRIADVICGSEIAKKEYNKMLLTYGYGLLSLFPTAYIDSQRGYFNDHNSLMCVYILSKLSTSRSSKAFWAVPMAYIWLLSRHWYNGYFTGLVNDCYPGLISEQYIQKCQNYLYEELPRTWTADVSGVATAEAPVKFNELYEDEFSPDIKQNYKYGLFDASLKTRGGLGFLATAVMLEKNPKELL